MKNLFIAVMMIASVLSYSQDYIGKKEFDINIQGCWKGTEKDQQYEGITKYWVSCRLEDGRSLLLFVTMDKFGNVNQHTENGNWWTNDGKFFEYHKKADALDIYVYKILSKEKIEFRSYQINGKKDDSYLFIDEKIEDL